MGEVTSAWPRTGTITPASDGTSDGALMTMMPAKIEDRPLCQQQRTSSVGVGACVPGVGCVHQA
jgi:hypothetical protein